MISMLYENWIEAGENWKNAKIYLQVSSTESNKRLGQREWLTRKELEEKYGEDGANAIIRRKLDDPALVESEVRDHPEAPECQALQQFKVLNMDKEIDTNETAIRRLYDAADANNDSDTEHDKNSSSTSSSSSSKSSVSSKKKKGKGRKEKTENKKEKETKKPKAG